MADNVQLFFNEYNGRPVDTDDFPKNQPYQCKDIVQKYVTECLALPALPQGDAWEMWNKAPVGFIKIPNTPKNVPLKGDIVIWKKVWLYLPFGHISIFNEGNVNNFVSFDQNWTSPHCQYEHHNYHFVQGWLRKK